MVTQLLICEGTRAVRRAGRNRQLEFRKRLLLVGRRCLRSWRHGREFRKAFFFWIFATPLAIREVYLVGNHELAEEFSSCEHFLQASFIQKALTAADIMIWAVAVKTLLEAGVRAIREWKKGSKAARARFLVFVLILLSLIVGATACFSLRHWSVSMDVTDMIDKYIKFLPPFEIYYKSWLPLVRFR